MMKLFENCDPGFIPIFNYDLHNLTIQSLSTPIWNNIPEHMKSAITVNTFKSMLKKPICYI